VTWYCVKNVERQVKVTAPHLNSGLLQLQLVPKEILANNQLDALFFIYLFISSLYMFQASQCSTSGD